jgi:LPXTG-motif cell wall-anchored protein
MRLTSSRSRRFLASAAVAAVASLAFAPIALAAPAKPAPTTDDTRAVAYDDNLASDWPTACSVGGLTGTVIATDKITFTGGKDKPDVDISAVAPGVTVTGVVVKGGDAYNIYLAAGLGATLPWNDLRSPFNNGGNIPTISHWYACGTVTVAEQPPGHGQPPKQEQPPTTTVTSPASSSSTAAPSTSVTTSPAAAAGELASTGFGSAWLLGLGAALVAAGAAVLLVLRRRRA